MSTIGESPRSTAVSLSTSQSNNKHSKVSFNGVSSAKKRSDEEKPQNNENHGMASSCNVQLLPIVSWKPGLQQKASPFALNSWTTLALTLDGRDKITKDFQYTTRFLSWWLAGTTTAHRMKALQQSLANSRKAFRLGRSLIELEKLKSMGMLRLFLSHLRRSTSLSFVHREENCGDKSLVKSMSWDLMGMALKTLGLLGFWAGDNVLFVALSGALDDFRLDDASRQTNRKKLQERASVFGNRCYFFAAVAGLLVNVRAYWKHRVSELFSAQRALRNFQMETKVVDPTEIDCALETLNKAQEKQFSLFLALLKSCCDVLVFSNNPGLDFHEKYRGKKMHEGFHCLCGFLSAATVLYANYPNAPK